MHPAAPASPSHHAVCQTIVRTAGAPHAETNAVMLPHSVRLMAARAPAAVASFGAALAAGGAEDGSPARLAARCGHTRLGPLGVTEEHVDRRSPLAPSPTRRCRARQIHRPSTEIAALVRAAL